MDDCRRKSCQAHREEVVEPMNPLPITVCIPVRNEAVNLPGCLASLDHAFAEVVVIDSASTDNTCSIAENAGAAVLQFSWDGRFPKKRNWVLRTHGFKTPWVLFLDADERLTPAVISELREILPSSQHAGYWLEFDNWFMGRMLRYGDVMRKLALFRIGTGEYEQFPENWWSHLDMEVHEHPILSAQSAISGPGSSIAMSEISNTTSQNTMLTRRGKRTAFSGSKVITGARWKP